MNNQRDLEGATPQPAKRKALVEALVALVAFCGLGGFSRLVPLVFLLVVLSGVGSPLLWTWRTRGWVGMGFTRHNLWEALLWGLGTGVLLLAVEWFTTSDRRVAPLLWLQLGVAIPIWVLIMSPFQEFFFRGWLQPRFQDALGVWSGLIVTSISFALWHLFPPFDQASIKRIVAKSGIAKGSFRQYNDGNDWQVSRFSQAWHR